MSRGQLVASITVRRAGSLRRGQDERKRQARAGGSRREPLARLGARAWRKERAKTFKCTLVAMQPSPLGIRG